MATRQQEMTTKTVGLQREITDLTEQGQKKINHIGTENEEWTFLNLKPILSSTAY